MPPLFQAFIPGCDNCALKQEWPKLHHPVLPMSIPEDPPAKHRIMMLGDVLGRAEDEQGKQFVGWSGTYLRNFIPPHWKRSLYWNTIIKCKPPDTLEEFDQVIKSCSSQFLENELAGTKPHVIFGFGNTVSQYFWEEKGISFIRGIPIPIQLKDKSWTWFYGTFHPGFVQSQEKLDDKGNKVNVYEPVFKADIRNFFNNVDQFLTPPKIIDPTIQLPNIIYPKTEEEVWNLFCRLKDPFVIDLETFKFKPYMRDSRILTAAFSDGDLTFSFPVNWPGTLNQWGKDVFTRIMRSNRVWIAQNSAFELIWIWTVTQQHNQNFLDTEVLARLIHKRPNLGKLEELSRIYLGFDVKKLTNFDKSRLLDYPIEKVLYYNALDSWSEYKVWEILDHKLPENQRGNYTRILQTIKSTVAMELYGLPVSQKESEVLEKDLQAKLDKYEKETALLPEVIQFKKDKKKTVRLSQDQLVAEILNDYCGIEIPLTDKKNFTIAADILEPFEGQHPLVDLRLDFMEVNKQLSTYVKAILSGEILGIDFLLHPSYTAIHTVTYRLSSKDPNIQNWPKRKHREIRRQIVPPPGYIIAAFDYGQLEARVMVMYSGDDKLRQDFINKVDIHTRWLMRVIELYPAYMDRLRSKSGETEEKKILKAGRDTIKTDFVFASLYGSIAKSISNRALLPLDIAIQLQHEFWTDYALTKRWIDKQFEFYRLHGIIQSLTGRVRDTVLPGNEVINTPVQGLAAEIVLEAQNALCAKGLTQDFTFLPRVNIHDDLGFFIPEKDELAEQYISEIGQEIVKPRFDFVTIPLTTECRIGYNWCDLNGITTFQGQYYKEGILIN